MIQELKAIIAQANANYIIEFDESRMMNVKVDEINRSDSFAYIEEYSSGRYNVPKFFKEKTTQVQIYFCKFTEFQNDADDREALRQLIETEIVIPFMSKYNESGKFKQVDNWNFFTTLPRFDANEVSIMLQFDCVVTYC